MKQKITKDDGTKVVISVDANKNSALIRIKNGLLNLVDTIFFETKNFSGVKIRVTKIGENYNYKIDYGEINPSLEEVAKLQEVAKNHFDLYLQNNSFTNGANLEVSSSISSPDIFGIKRITKYLMGVK